MSIAGSLNRKITIERKVVTRNTEYNEDVVTWEPLVMAQQSVEGERWAAQVLDVLPSRSEAFKQGLKVGLKQARIRLRWRSDIDSTMRVIVHGDSPDSDEVYQIIGGPSDVDGRRRLIELLCEKYSTDAEAQR